MSKWRVTGPWMTEDEAWNELADLEMAGIHYNLEERMAYDTICLKCSGLIARPGATYGYSGEFCSCPDEEIIEEYADYAKQEIRFCPYCGAALGMKEDIPLTEAIAMLSKIAGKYFDEAKE